MIKKFIPVILIVVLLFSLFLVPSHAAVDHKGFYFENEKGVGLTAAVSGNNVETLFRRCTKNLD